MVTFFTSAPFIILCIVLAGALLLLLAAYTPLVALYFGLLAPIANAATAFASSVIGVTRSAIAAAPAAVAAAYGMGLALAQNAAMSIDAFAASVAISSLAFGIINKSLSLLDLFTPYRQIQAAIWGVYSKGALFLLLVGLFFGAAVFLDIFPLIQMYIDEAYCLIVRFFTLVDFYLNIIGQVYNVVAPLFNYLGAWVYDLAAEILADLLVILLGALTILIRIVNDPAALAIPPSHMTCIGYTDSIAFPSTREQVTCLAKDALRFAIDGVVLRIFSAIPGVDNAAQSLAHEIVWLGVDAITRSVQFLAQVVNNPGGCTDPSDCYRCSLGNPDMETCCPVPAMLCVIKRFFALGSRVGFLLYQLIIEIPVIGDVIQVVAELASLLAEIFNKYIRDPLNFVLNLILQPIGLFVNGIIEALCVFLHVIDDVVPGDIIPDDSHCGIGSLNIPVDPFPEIPIITELQVDTPPTVRRRRMLLDLDGQLPLYDAGAARTRYLHTERARMYHSTPEFDILDGDSWPRVRYRAAGYKDAFMEWVRNAAVTYNLNKHTRGDFGASYASTRTRTGRRGDFGGCYAVHTSGHSTPASKTISLDEITGALRRRFVRDGLDVDVDSRRALYEAADKVLHLHPDTIASLQQMLATVEAQNATKNGTRTAPPSPSPPSPPHLTVHGVLHDKTLTVSGRGLLDFPDLGSGLLKFVVHVFTTAIEAAGTGLVILTKWVLETLAVLLDVLPSEDSSSITVSSVVTLDPLLPVRLVRLAISFFLNTLGETDMYGRVEDIDLDAEARAIQRWGNLFTRRVMGALIENARLLLQALLEGLLDLRWDSLTGLVAFLYSKIECSSASSYHPNRNPDGEYRIGCIARFLIPPEVPIPLIDIPSFIEWGVACLAPARTCTGIFGNMHTNFLTNECIPCHCPAPGYAKCDTVFPTGMHLLSGILSGTLEWVSGLVDGVTTTIAGVHLKFTMEDVIAIQIPIFIWTPTLRIDIGAVRPVDLVPLFEQFLRLGIDAEGRSIAREAFPGVRTDSEGVPAGFACIVVALPSVTWHLFVVLGWLGLYFAVLPLLAAVSLLTASLVFIGAWLLFSLLFVLFSSMSLSSMRLEIDLLGDLVSKMAATNLAAYGVPVTPIAESVQEPQPSPPPPPSSSSVIPVPTAARAAAARSKGGMSLLLYGGRRRHANAQQPPSHV